MGKWINIDDLPSDRVEWDDILDAPSIDIVRCKECKHWWETTGANYGDCEHFALDTIADGFCSYGEREGE